MTNEVYYYAEELIVFPTKKDARNYFFENQLMNEYNDDYEFRQFLNENYTIDEVFKLTDDEKVDIIEDYEEELFEDWVYNELVKCELYER